MKSKSGTKVKRTTRGKHWRAAELDRLVDEATVDCYGESECATGFLTMIEENVEFPFETLVLGVPVTVERVDLTERDEIVAICRKGNQRQRILLGDLLLPSPPPPGAEWIAAYRRWARTWNGQIEDES